MNASTMHNVANHFDNTPTEVKLLVESGNAPFATMSSYVLGISNLLPLSPMSKAATVCNKLLTSTQCQGLEYVELSLHSI